MLAETMERAAKIMGENGLGTWRVRRGEHDHLHCLVICENHSEDAMRGAEIHVRHVKNRLGFSTGYLRGRNTQGEYFPSDASLLPTMGLAADSTPLRIVQQLERRFLASLSVMRAVALEELRKHEEYMDAKDATAKKLFAIIGERQSDQFRYTQSKIVRDNPHVYIRLVVQGPSSVEVKVDCDGELAAEIAKLVMKRKQR